MVGLVKLPRFIFKVETLVRTVWLKFSSCKEVTLRLSCSYKCHLLPCDTLVATLQETDQEQFCPKFLCWVCRTFRPGLLGSALECPAPEVLDFCSAESPQWVCSRNATVSGLCVFPQELILKHLLPEVCEASTSQFQISVFTCQRLQDTNCSILLCQVKTFKKKKKALTCGTRGIHFPFLVRSTET